VAAREAISDVWDALGDLGDELEVTDDGTRLASARRRALEQLQDNLLRVQGDAEALLQLFPEGGR
jgi:hypothetical protein